MFFLAMTIAATKPDPMAPYFPTFFIFWITFGIATWIWIQTRPNAEQKRKWYRAFVFISTLIFGGFLVLVFVRSGQPFTFLLVLPILALIMWLNLRCTDFCPKCSRRVYNPSPWRRIEFCPYCGAELSRPI